MFEAHPSSDAMAVGADELALVDLGLNSFQTEPTGSQGGDVGDLLAMNVVKVHRRGMKYLPAVAARLRLHCQDICRIAPLGGAVQSVDLVPVGEVILLVGRLALSGSLHAEDARDSNRQSRERWPGCLGTAAVPMATGSGPMVCSALPGWTPTNASRVTTERSRQLSYWTFWCSRHHSNARSPGKQPSAKRAQLRERVVARTASNP